jgi:hypothetical protein
LLSDVASISLASSLADSSLAYESADETLAGISQPAAAAIGASTGVVLLVAGLLIWRAKNKKQAVEKASMSSFTPAERKPKVSVFEKTNPGQFSGDLGVQKKTAARVVI